MNIPDYAKDAIYQELANICELAGQKITYNKLDESIAGMSNRYGNIEMPDDHPEEFITNEAATKVLGHELGHCFLENPSSTFVKTFDNLLATAKQYTEADQFIYECDELIADLAGEFLYSLAEMIAMHKSNQA